jgi:hypothetical protein
VHEKRLFQCKREGCDKEFKRNFRLKDHVTYDHDLMAWTCGTCSKQSRRKCSCTEHIKKKKTSCEGEPALKKRTDVE